MYGYNTMLFQDISKNDCAKMMGCFHAKARTFTQGEAIFKNGDEKDKIGIITSGVVIIERIDYQGNRTILERLETGEIFGETIAFSSYGNDLFVAVAEKDSEVFFITYNDITKSCSNSCACHALLINNMLTIISEKAMRLSERIEILSNRTIREKLKSYFRLQVWKQNDSTFVLPFTMSALADYLCVDRSAMTRELRKMKEEDLLVVQKRKIKLNY